MSGNQKLKATVLSKGRITLPAALRATLGIHAGSRIHIELRGDELIIKSVPDMSAHSSRREGYELDITEPEKDSD